MVADKSSSPSAHEITAKLLAHRNAFKAFLASRVGNEADAEDLLQNGLVKALSRADEIKDGEKAVARFYQLLRNVIIDLFNSKRPGDLATAEGREYLKEEIKNAINGFMISGKVRGVYFTNFALSG